MTSVRGSLGSLIGMVVVAAFPWSCGADDNARIVLQQRMKNASSQLRGVCRDAWRYDNLRPTILRAIAPLETTFDPPEVPVVHLSPGSPDYRQTVGVMMYQYGLYNFQKQRLAAFDAMLGTTSSSGGTASARPMGEPELWEETDQVGGEWDETRANYAKACGWAWPYVNLRPRCRQPGIEAATILNPLIPVPVIRLSEESPDYGVISFSLDYWERKIHVADTQWNDLLDDHKAVAAATASLKLDPFDEEILRSDERLAKMFKVHQQLKQVLRQWRSAQHEIERFAPPWHDAKVQCASLQFQTYVIQKVIRKSQLAGLQHLDSRGDVIRVDATVQNLRDQLATLTPQIDAAQKKRIQIERSVGQLRGKQSELVQQNEALTTTWIQLCDVAGRYGPVSHHRAITAFNHWMVEEPRGWHLYLARGVANMHNGNASLTGEDIGRAHGKMALYDPRPGSMAFMMAIRGYALCLQNDARGGERWFNEAKKTDRTAWMPALIRGWSNVTRSRHPQAKLDFQTAVRLGKKSQPETCEAMALLLASSPHDAVRDGPKAVEYAQKACDLTNYSDWVCLDTLAAAYAEAGDFDSAVDSAKKSLQCAPQDNKDSIKQRLTMYQSKKTYRLK